MKGEGEAVRLFPTALIAGLASLLMACAPSPGATANAPAASSASQSGTLAGRTAATPTPSTAPSIILGVDRGVGLPPLIGEAEKQEGTLRVRAWVSKTEVLATEDVTVFAAVERDGKPLPNASVLVMVGGTRDGGTSITNLRTGPDGLASTTLAGSLFRLAVPSQILVSAIDGQNAADAELRIFVDNPGGASS